MTTPSQESLTAQDFYQIIWGRIDSEANLLSQKLSTLINSQAFLFLGYVSLLNSPATLRATFLGNQHHLLLWLFPVVAFTVLLFMYLSMIGSHLTIKHLAKRYEEAPKNLKMKQLPSIHADKRFLSLSNGTIIVLPWLLSIAWILILLLQYRLDGTH